MRVARETAPEAIDKLQHRRLQLEVEIHALEREKDQASKDRLAAAHKAMAEIDDELQPLKAAYEAEKKRGDEINNVRKRIDELKAKADDAERRQAFLILFRLISGTLCTCILDMTFKPLQIFATMLFLSCRADLNNFKLKKYRKKKPVGISVLILLPRTI